jgi:hypothetical protein
MSTTCQFEGCKVHPKNGVWCAKHSYRAAMGQCEFIKPNGERCDKLTSKQLCKCHCFNRTPNQCAYIGAINGCCTNMCKKTFCPTHNPKSIKIRNDTTRIYSKQKYQESKVKKELLNELIGQIIKPEIQLTLPEDIYNKIIQLS